MLVIYSLIFCLLHLIINQLIITSKNKIIILFFSNLLVIFILYENFFLDYFIYYLSLQYLFINIYTIRYSSIRFLILDRIVANETLPDEEWLYHDRISRIKNTQDGKIIMQNKVFFILKNIIKYLNFLFK